MSKKRLTPTQFEIDGLRDLCKNNDCDMPTLIDAVMSNVVSEQISIQIHYKKTGELPGVIKK